MAKISNNLAINAYQKVLQSSKVSTPKESLKLAEQTMNILKAGDNLQVNNSNKSSATSFPDIVKQIATEQVETIKATEPVTKQAFMPTSDGDITGTNNVNLVRAYTEAEATLMLVQEVRAQLVSSLQDIIKTPL